MSLVQDYIDNTIYQIQCCLGELVAQIADQEYIGVDCSELKARVKLIKAIQNSLVRNRPEYVISEIDGELKDKCLSDDEINDLIEKAKESCKKCCIDEL